MSDTIKDILDGITFHPSDIDMDNERRDYAEQAINDYILGEVMELLSGDDKVHPKLRKWNEDTNKNFIRNQLRQELRNKANKQFGGSDE
jgi:hypothetical protein